MDPDRDTVEAVLDVARVLVAVSVRSLAATGDAVTVSQLRVLMLVAGRERTGVADVAAELGVHPSNATRVVGRLTRAGLLDRSPDERDRRSVRLRLTTAGEQLVSDVDDHRRVEIARILSRVPEGRLAGATGVWRAFAGAGGSIG